MHEIFNIQVGLMLAHRVKEGKIDSPRRLLKILEPLEKKLEATWVSSTLEHTSSEEC